MTGRKEGVKDRPCAVVLAFEDEENRTRVQALPITDSPPGAGEAATKSLAAVKTWPGLDSERSSVVVTEANVSVWPRPDLRFPPEREPGTAVFGFPPAGFFRAVRDRFLATHGDRMARMMAWTE